MEPFFYQISFLTSFSPTLLRLVAGACFAYTAWFLFKKEGLITHTPLPLIGKPHAWMVSLSAAIVAMIATMLIIGYETRLAALIAAIVTVKHLYGLKKFPQLIPLSLGTYLLLLAICISLVVTGGGLIAFDSPLY
jgi:uncharacterized membrane protein YphA (DoxX/SURF4 family)